MIRLTIITLIFVLRCSPAFTQAPVNLVPVNIHLQDGTGFQLKVPAGYHISVAAEGLKRPRFFAKAPDGRLFITDMYDRSDNKKGKLLLLDGWNEQRKQFDTVITFLDKLHNPNQAVFYSSGHQDFLYIAETGRLTLRTYRTDELTASPNYQVIATFPDYGLHYKYGGWHLTRSITIHNDKLYVSVGSSCNACVEKEPVRATILEMNPDGTNQKIHARGVRNAVGIKWVGDKLWVTHMGRDGIGPDKPEDLLHTIKKDGYYGWPYYVQYRKRVYDDVTFKDSSRALYVKKPPVAEYGFKAHSAPLGFEYFSGFDDPLMNNSFLVALHGSTSVWRQRGNAVVQVMKDGTYRDIITGFLQGTTEAKRYGRPCDIIRWSSRSFFISDDKSGVIYYVWKD
jgi:glucose/arabinose dehydrogenase